MTALLSPPPTGFTDSLWVAVVLAAVTGAGNMIFLVPSITMVQQQTPPEMCGRVVGVRHMLTFTAFMISNAVAGALATRLGSARCWPCSGRAWPAWR